MNDEFELHAIDGYIETLYLAVYTDKILVLDCGCACDARTVIDYVEQKLRRPVSSIKLAVATHCHPDHMGGARILQKKYGIKIAAPSLINSWYDGLAGAIQHIVDIVLSHYVAFVKLRLLRRIWFRRHLRPDFPLQDGQPLPFFGDWTVLDTPGHTNHDVVLYNRAASVLYAADLIVKVGSRYVLPIPVTFSGQLLESFERVKPLQVRKLALAHKGIHDVDDFVGVVESLQKKIQPHKRRRLTARIAGVLQSISPATRPADGG